MYCEKCGQEIQDHATFCGKCGAKVRNASSERTIEQTEKRVKERQVDGKALLLVLTGFCLLIAIVMGCCFVRRSLADWNKTRIVSMGEEKVENTEISDSVEQENNLMSKEVVGSTIIFGSFEQDNNLENGAEPIEWIVLDKQGDKLLLLSKKVLDSRNYYGANYPVTWEESHLRFWLNSVFYETAFTEEEQQRILLTEVVNDDNADYGTDGGNDTEDNIFLLSIKEVKDYHPDNWSSEGTAYAMDKGLYMNDENYAAWWLRSPGNDTYLAAYVDDAGGIDEDGDYGDYVRDDRAGVRPTLWVSVEK